MARSLMVVCLVAAPPQDSRPYTMTTTPATPPQYPLLLLEARGEMRRCHWHVLRCADVALVERATAPEHLLLLRRRLRLRLRWHELKPVLERLADVPCCF